MSERICIFGNIVADFIAASVTDMPDWGELVEVPDPIDMNIGGNGAIAAVAAARFGLIPQLIGKVGEDEHGRILLGALKENGIDIENIEIVPQGRTGVTLALANKTGERLFFHHRGINSRLTGEELNKVSYSSISALLICSVFLLTGLDHQIIKGQLQKAKTNEIPVFLDIAWDPSGGWDLDGILDNVDFFMPNEEELFNITQTRSLERAGNKILNEGTGTIVVKQGAKGCTILQPYKDPVIVEAPVVTARDTTGAGDVFNAAFIYKYLRTNDIIESTGFAVDAASLSTTMIGGTTASPTETEINKFRKK